MTTNAERYAYLIESEWDRTFLSNPNFSHWFVSQMEESPIPPGTPLVDYVRDRIQFAKGQSAATASASAPAPAPAPAPAQAPATAGAGGGDEVLDQYFAMDDYAPDEEANTSANLIHAEPPAETPPPAYTPFEAVALAQEDAFTRHRPQHVHFAAVGGVPSAQGGREHATATLAMQRHLVQQEQDRAQANAQRQTAQVQPQGFSPATFGGAPAASTSASASASASSSGSAAPKKASSNSGSSKGKSKATEDEPAAKRKKTSSASTSAGAPKDPTATNGSTKGKEKASTSTASAKKPAVKMISLFDDFEDSDTPSPRAATASSSSLKAAPTAKKPAPAKPIARPVAVAASTSAAAAPSTSTSAAKPSSRSSTPQPPSVASSSTSSSTSASTAAQEKSWSLILPTLREAITPLRLLRASASTAQKLSKILLEFQLPASSDKLGPWGDGSEVPPSGRKEVIEVLLKPIDPIINPSGRSEFWTACVGKGAEAGLEVWQSWLLGASSAVASKKGDEKDKDKVASKRTKELEGTLVGVLKIITKLPLTLEHLKKYSKFGARIKRISLRGEGEAKTLSQKLVERWSALQQEANSRVTAAAIGSTSAAAGKKDEAKAASAAKSKEDEAAKKRKAAESLDEAKKKPKPTPPAPQPTAASLFASKALPSASFKKPAKPDPPASSFASALAAMQKKQAISAPKPEEPKAVGGIATKGKGRKIKKSVKWTDEAQDGGILVHIKWIERREQNIDQEGIDEHDTQKMMEGEEGQVHAMHLGDQVDELEEEIDWYEPIIVEIPKDAQQEQATSQAAEIETTRQATCIVRDGNDRPSPGEPNEPYTPLTEDAKYIPLSLDLRDDASVQATIAHAQASTIPLGGFAANEQIQTLLGQLTGGGAFGVPPPQHQQQWQHQPQEHQQGFDQATLQALQNYDPALIRGIVEQTPGLASLAGQLDHLGVYGAQPHQQLHEQQQAYYGQDPYGGGYNNTHAPIPSAWNSGGGGYNPQPYQPPAPSLNPSGSGKRQGVQKGRKRFTMPCKFFNHPRGCDRGDDCPFIHERNGKDVRG